MKRRGKIISYLTVIISLISIFAAFRYIEFEKLFTIDWGILGWVSLSVLIFTLISFVATTLLMMRRNRILRVYLSYSYSNKEEVDKIKYALAGENVITSDSIKPGTSIKELNRIIRHSHVCFLAVGKTPTAMQKEEMKIMRSLGKDTYVISMDKEGRVPSIARNEVPLYTNDENFDKKVEDILLSYK